VSARIPIDQEALAAFCRKWHVAELSLFGSVLRDDFGPDSDVDVLVVFQGERTPGWHIVTMEDELSRLLGRRVDLVCKPALYRLLKDRILAEAEVQYVAS
jgi:predicted nucleotidyltransferase